ncbi:MAG TPA: ABC-F family ATP-binding cassette domain-containing protein [Bacteroidales bacterium]|nr:ABC-F family ATP-binding cassette domain-containing protein [Bacteroidales bacterium]HPS16507.1 ABC-F family ATP-binding cassette domain-containing protein [Bacteroidales bacterium]
MISVNNLSVHFTGTNLFDDVSFVIADKDRVGLVGKNGAGKTTLMRIIAGIQEPESGNVIIPSGNTIGFLPQEITFVNSGKTVIEEAMTAFSEALKLEEKIKKVTSEIASRTDFESESYYNLLHKLTDANERFQLLGGHNMQGETEKVLLGLGFLHSDFSRSISEFSGGWQMRVELAKILLQKPNFILLDEPTNHLDIESIQWLEDFLINYYGAVMLVSHDRAFLDNITIRTIEISLGKTYDYKASYSVYEKMRTERIEHQTAAYNNQQKQIADNEKFINRFRYQATKARQVQSRIKLLDKIERIEIDETDNSSIYFRFPPAPHSGKVIIEANHLTKNYGSHNILNDLNFLINKGERLAFVGKNGEGKTTLSRIIVQELDYTGEIKHGHNVKLGYYAQNQSDLLNPDKTVFETIDDAAVGEIRPKIRSILGSFLFDKDDIEKKVKVLSGGEKSRLALAKLILSPVNFLVLDEPTNHLDMRSKDILKQALLKFDGTLLIVSHDRYFLHGLTNRIFEFKNHTIREYLGDIYDFLKSRKIESLQQLEVNKKTTTQKDKKENTVTNKSNYEKRKVIEKELRKIKTLIEKSEEKISQLEQLVKETDEKLINPETYKEVLSDKTFYASYEKNKKLLEEEMKQWEELHVQYEEKESEYNRELL